MSFLPFPYASTRWEMNVLLTEHCVSIYEYTVVYLTKEKMNNIDKHCERQAQQNLSVYWVTFNSISAGNKFPFGWIKNFAISSFCSLHFQWHNSSRFLILQWQCSCMILYMDSISCKKFSNISGRRNIFGSTVTLLSLKILQRFMLFTISPQKSVLLSNTDCFRSDIRDLAEAV